MRAYEPEKPMVQEVFVETALNSTPDFQKEAFNLNVMPVF